MAIYYLLNMLHDIMQTLFIILHANFILHANCNRHNNVTYLVPLDWGEDEIDETTPLLTIILYLHNVPSRLFAK